MAKKKVGEEDSFFQDLASKTGGDIVANIDSVKYFVDAGNLAVNYICSGRFMGGGIPGGKLTEIYGPSSSSKSLIGTNILFGCQRAGGVAILEDCENSANKEFIQMASHCDLSRIVRHTPQTLEEVFHKMYKSMEFIRSKKKDGPIAIVYDSIGVSPSARELREVNLPENASKADFKRIVGGNEQPGERAKICSREFRKLNTVMEKNDATVVILNQTRSKIGVMYGNPTTTAGGGNALPFYASCRLETSTMKKIEYKLSAKKTKILGINIRIKNVKNKTHRPFISTENIQLLFEHGINPVSGLLSCLMDANRVVAKGTGYFVVSEPYCNGEEVKFKASLEKNEVPIEVLLRCPSIIDAASEEEVSEYLAPFKAAIDFQISGDIIETDMMGESDEDIDSEME
jgi:protein RecA